MKTKKIRTKTVYVLHINFKNGHLSVPKITENSKVLFHTSTCKVLFEMSACTGKKNSPHFTKPKAPNLLITWT